MPAEGKTEKKTEAATPPPPEAPPMPSMKMSQILPMVVMLGMNQYDLAEMGYRRHSEAGFVIAQLLCFGVLYYLYTKINSLPDGGPKIKVPEVKQMGQVVAPAKEQTPKEYDLEKFMEQVKQAVMGSVILGGIYYKWEYLMPLVLQILMTPLQLYESPLFEIHILGKTTVTRPFPTPNPFGLPSAPEPPAQIVEEKEDNNEKKEEKKEEKKDK